MSADTQIESEKLFEYYSLFPPKLRMMVTNMMEPSDRFIYGMCSRKYNAEVMASSKIQTLGLQLSSENRIVVDVRHSDSDILEVLPGFKVEFHIENQQIYMIYLTSNDQQLWWKLLDKSRINVFNKFRDIKKLSIDWTLMESNIDFGVRNLKSLKELKIIGNIDYHQFISDLSKPLDDLSINTEIHCQNPMEHTHIFEVQNQLIYPNLQMNNDQFLRLSASTISIHIGKMTVTDVFNFIQLWHSGKKVKQVTWSLQKTKFDITQLFRCLDLKPFTDKARIVKIRHHSDAKKRAVLDFKPGTLKVTFFERV